MEAWFQARAQDAVSQSTLRTNLAHLRGWLMFLEARGWPIGPNLFRIKPPQPDPDPLPRYLAETE